LLRHYLTRPRVYPDFAGRDHGRASSHALRIRLRQFQGVTRMASTVAVTSSFFN
jgi:hypothetical protein